MAGQGPPPKTQHVGSDHRAARGRSWCRRDSRRNSPALHRAGTAVPPVDKQTARAVRQRGLCSICRPCRGILGGEGALMRRRCPRRWGKEMDRDETAARRRLGEAARDRAGDRPAVASRMADARVLQSSYEASGRISGLPRKTSLLGADRQQVCAPAPRPARRTSKTHARGARFWRGRPR